MRRSSWRVSFTALLITISACLHKRLRHACGPAPHVRPAAQAEYRRDKPVREGTRRSIDGVEPLVRISWAGLARHSGIRTLAPHYSTSVDSDVHSRTLAGRSVR